MMTVSSIENKSPAEPRIYRGVESGGNGGDNQGLTKVSNSTTFLPANSSRVSPTWHDIGMLRKFVGCHMSHSEDFSHRAIRVELERST